jgi:hypothetical protein
MKFTTSPYKNYLSDIKILEYSIKNGENISFSKFCDGEWSVICNQAINNKEFWFDPNNENDQIKRQALIDSFVYKNPRYFVGITCTKVFGLETHRQMKSICQQDEDHLTWADIWVNSNYSYYLSNIVPLYSTKPVVLFCNGNAKIENLPFIPHTVVKVGNNAWQENWELVKEWTSTVKTEMFKDMIFLFCCGPFGNILCHQLTQSNENNTYLDIGSTLNPFLQSAGFDRHYYLGNNYFSNMIGEWDQ